MKKRYFILALLLAITVAGYSQKKPAENKAETVVQTESSSNLVSDGSFEVSEVKTLKAYGQLTTFLKSWSSPNQTSADVYNVIVKASKCAIPKNDYGTEEALDGSSYAGFRAYTKDPKKNRTYLQTKLSQKLEKDKLYCVRFNVSLADLSKYGVSNVGLFFSDRKVQNANDNAVTFQPHITEKTNKPLVTLEGWQTICGTFLGTGKEEYIIIGCFGLEDNLKLEKVRKPASQEGVVMGDVYYYLDKVEITAIEAQSQCFCGKTEDRNPDLIYSRSNAKGLDLKPDQIISSTAVWFSFLSAEIPSMFTADLTEVVRVMKANPKMQLHLTGHSETDEINEAKINRHYLGMSDSRVTNVKKFLVENGVEELRISVDSKDNSQPASEKITPLGKAQNRRVEFTMK